MEKEHNGSVDDTVDKFFATLDETEQGEQQEERSPSTEQADKTQEGGSDPQKTPSTEESAGFKGVDKGFANHPKWIERETKLKEAQARAKKLESSNSQYAKLLDDPQVYSKWLKSQGFSEDHIRQAMLEKGFAQPQGETDTARQETAQDIAKEACKDLGWDINRLSKEQVAYLNDHVALTMKILDKRMGAAIDARMKPLEGYVQQTQLKEKLSGEEAELRKMAKEEFPTLDWDKDIEPAMQKYLDELDKRDPQKQIKIGFEDLYQRATRNLLKELSDSKGRQEVRNENKGNARPLRVGASPANNRSGNEYKGKSPSETADKFLDSLGVR